VRKHFVLLASVRASQIVIDNEWYRHMQLAEKFD